jgi:hypothetical protein
LLLLDLNLLGLNLLVLHRKVRRNMRRKSGNFERS